MLVLPEKWMKRWKGEDIFEKIFSLKGKVYKDKDNRRTMRFTFDGGHYFAKIHAGVGWKEIFKNLLQLRLPVLGAQNEWLAIQGLGSLGVNTTPLVGYGKKGWNPARLKSFVITRELSETKSLEDFCRHWPMSPPIPGFKHTLIQEVAKIARTMHKHGMTHRDFYLCHILIKDPEGADRNDLGDRIYLIDLHRVQRHERLRTRWMIKDIAALYFSSMDIGLTKSDLLRFIKAYTNKPLRLSLDEDKRFWHQVKKRGNTFYKDFKRKSGSEN